MLRILGVIQDTRKGWYTISIPSSSRAHRTQNAGQSAFAAVVSETLQTGETLGACY